MSSPPLRVGRIAYTNVAPVETAFDCGAVIRDAVVHTAVPATLNASLASGELDAGPVSAAFYLRHTAELALLGDTCIAARGDVISVVLASSRPPTLLADTAIAVTRDSASGLALLDVILRRRYAVDAVFDPVDDAMTAALAGRPALLIGDAAIEIRDRVPPSDMYDLGRAWFDWTGLPMVFAVWAVRRDVAAQRPDDIAALAQAYTAARAWGQAHRPQVIAAARQLRPRDAAFYEHYFSTLFYELDDTARAGLARFGTELAPLEVPRVAR